MLLFLLFGQLFLGLGTSDSIIGLWAKDFLLGERELRLEACKGFFNVKAGSSLCTILGKKLVGQSGAL
jgi:hypothetical protein